MSKMLHEQYINIIKKQEAYDKNVLNRLLKKHNYEFTFECLMDLSKLYNWNEIQSGFDERLALKFKNDYGITKEYQDNQDKNWNKL